MKNYRVEIQGGVAPGAENIVLQISAKDDDEVVLRVEECIARHFHSDAKVISIEVPADNKVHIPDNVKGDAS
ncbi:hypothetical protein C4587_01875 [Candidatus Parcubacteria bacterium]|nr:MAG: hypothetical protein C4587_01875 [Candidatus Parcubacteria bacterium]